MTSPHHPQKPPHHATHGQTGAHPDDALPEAEGCCGHCHGDCHPPEADAAPAAQADAAALHNEIADLKDQCLRAQAETQNARRRADEEVAKARKFGIESFAESLLPVLDSLDAALATENASAEQLREGSEATLRQLLAALDRNKVVAIAPAQGERFDPHQQQAISVVPAPEGMDLPPNSVVNVLQKGYLIADRVLRPALVMVTPG